MTKRFRSDRQPYDIRPVSLIRSGRVQSQEALDNLSRYEEVSRQFAQEFPHVAWSLEQQSWIPWFLSPITGRQNRATAALAGGSRAADSSTSPMNGLAYDSEFASSIGCDVPRNFGGDFFDALPYAMTTATASPADQQGNPDPLTPPDTDSDSGSPCDLDALTSQLLWHNEVQELIYNRALQSRNEEQIRNQWSGQYPTIAGSLATQPIEERESSDMSNKAPAEAYRVDRDEMNQIMIDLNQLGSRLREDARRQLDVISDDMRCYG
ncbi:hypothetical protein V8C35DRAFT_292525 [Trichoderma chlorosporum]